MIEFNTKQRLLPRSESNKITALREERFTDRKFFMKKFRHIIRNNEYRKAFGGPGLVYEYLWAYIVRARMSSDVCNIYDKYYNKGFLACTHSLRKLSKECHIDKNTIMKYTGMWEKSGIIKIDKISTGIKNHKSQCIYILGTWQYMEGVKRERLYLEDEFDE